MPDLENLLNIEDEVTQVLSDLGVTAKLEEVDDFMNQNDLKVSITNESNAATTGLVTYTCTVKDNDNTALPNRVVEWYKGTTLLGLDATDSNGISTFSHRVTEADIYDVHAVVRGTHAGDDIRMFVKEKRNLFSHDVWCMGDRNTPNLEIGATILTEFSDDWSIKGNTSLKATLTAVDPSSGARAGIILDDNSFAGKTLKVSMNVKTSNSTWRLEILNYVTSWGASISTVDISPGESSLCTQVTIPEGTTRVWVRLKDIGGGVGDTIYTDNWCLEEV